MTSKRIKLITMGAAVVALGALSACGSGQVGQTDSGNSGTASKNLTLVPGVQNEPFYISMQCGAEAEARAAGYQLQTQAPQKFEATLQTPIVTALGANKPGGLLIAPTDDIAMAAPISQLKQMGVKIIEVDTALTDTTIAQSTITSNNDEGGRLAARTLAQLAGGKSGSVLVLDTKAGTSTTGARAKGFVEELAKTPNLKSIGIQFTDNEPEQAAAKVTAALSANKDLIGVFATNLNTGEGASTGLKNSGKTGKVNLVGFDASPSEVNGLRSGDFQALIAQDPATIGKQGVRQAIAAIEGKPVTRNLDAPLIAITKADMDSKAQYFYKNQC
ncbi:monosaccharide ABC transporter substrate-binding protein (CUT2 family) [Herbihabitans rhizosphaerae]|uniref:Monosaccharide ABC transporter substrate-binding protein (CUT2 family) n=1 Tax=Herbihabitans rhizosphaerae TaxID=1872711 RepID=A0A4Q7KQA4_9PSEU|nr:ABC transporter substrate-binding protein [Herbihabitans rhizosphaerae]RZS38989.1 monosaccharide ABC transporter substrate-binding protein (CUT2 family) [Herbihabitans rhizosphaerae]